MNPIIVNRNGNVLSGSCNGVPFSIPYSEGKHQAMKELSDKARNAKTLEELKYLVSQFELLTKENYADFVETKSPYLKVNKDTNRFYLQYNGVISSETMPDNFAKKIIKATEKELDILPIIKCWVRFLHCPVYTASKAEKFSEYISAQYVNKNQVQWLQQNKGLSEVVALEFSTTTQVSLTVEGLIVCYKVSKDITGQSSTMKQLTDKKRLVLDEQTGLVKYDEKDYSEYRIFEPVHMGQGGDPFYCDDYLGHIIKVGRSHRLQSWNHIDTNDNHSAVPGLHVGGLNYINGYQGIGTITHNILVDPMHVGAVVGTGPGLDGAMRVVQYFVLNAFNGVNKTLYHSSTYASMTDKEYRKMIEQAVNRNS